jgi:putative tryptophan/tyrosine transport system substrate-binding protein
MRRRELFKFLAATVATASAQSSVRAQPKQRRLAFVHSGIPADKLTEAAGPFWVRRVYETLRGLGDVEGSNLIVERFSAEGRSERFASLAAEVVGRAPDVVIVNLNDLVKAFTQATSTIPLVAVMGDPIAAGFISNIARPGGNLTGVAINAGIEIYGKRLQIIQEAMPKVRKIATLFSGIWTVAPDAADYIDAGRRLGIEVVAKEMGEVNETQLHRVFAEMADQHFEAAVVDEGGSFLAQRAVLTKLAEEHRLPVIYPYRDYVELGGLIAYAPDLGELAQRIAGDVHQILGGTRAGDIPFYQPSKFQLIINAKAAKAIGLDLPPSLLLRADEVIE